MKIDLNSMIGIDENLKNEMLCELGPEPLIESVVFWLIKNESKRRQGLT